MTEALSHFPLIFGFIAAMIHVISGPDHLAAIAPIAVSTRFRPWMIGMSWGVGHLIGMLLIGILFFFFREFIPVELISEYSEKIVGLMLILIGLWSIGRLIHYNRKTKHKHVHTHKDDEGNAYVHLHDHDHGEAAHHKHIHSKPERQTYLAALGIGILHGLAGFSHIFHLLPTLAFNSRFDSGMYLVGFGAGTIAAMILFSVLLGIIANYTHKFSKDNVFKVVNGFTGGIAIFVGFFWLWNTW